LQSLCLLYFAQKGNLSVKNHSIRRQFARYASLNAIGTLGLSCYILADTFFIANRLGSGGLAALNLILPVYNLIFGIGSMLGIGGATHYSIHRAQGNPQQANQFFTASCRMVALFSLPFMICGLFFSGQLSTLLGADQEIFSMTQTYLRVMLLFTPAYMTNNVLAAYTRNDGAPRLAMIAQLSGSLFNILFDYLLLYSLNMGMLGAVLATGFSPLVGILVLSTRILRKKSQFRLERGKLATSCYTQCMALGAPSLITELSSGVVILVFNFLLLRLGGTVAVAAYGVVANLSLVVVGMFSGIAQGVQPLVSQAYGRSEHQVSRQVLHLALGTVLVLSALLYLGIYHWADLITELFNSDGVAELHRLAVAGLKRYFTGTAFAGVNIVLSMYFSAIKRPLPAQIISICRGLVIIVPMTFLLAALWQINGVWLAFPAAEGVVMFLAFILYRIHSSK
jgi:putative MATE family efflux protein